MLVFAFTVLAIVLIMLAREVHVSSQTPTIRSEDGACPKLSLEKQCRWHLFNSHTWSSGAYQAQTIKRMLIYMLPGSQIFLDVDDLLDTTLLADYISQSQCILLFLSRNCEFHLLLSASSLHLSVHSAVLIAH